MRIVVAPDSFKGSLTALEAANRIEAGLKAADKNFEIVKIPIADGGEGTVDALLAAAGGRKIECNVHGPLMEMRKAVFGIIGKDENIAVIEMAEAAGITLIGPENRNPVKTTTYGVGELIMEAMDSGCKKMIIGIGGSATNDGGIGMAQALGAKFYLENGELIWPGDGANSMEFIDRIDTEDMDERLKDVEITVACDVNNPMVGPHGATLVYGPQKGATREQLIFLEDGMLVYSKLLEKVFKRDIAGVPGSGAAGGLGGGMIAFLNAELKSGTRIVIENTDFGLKIKDADLLITGEGRTDSQTVFGKVPVGLAKIAKNHNVLVICLSGSLGDGYEELYNSGIDYIVSCIDCPMDLEFAMANAGELLEKAAFGIGKLISRK